MRPRLSSVGAAPSICGVGRLMLDFVAETFGGGGGFLQSGFKEERLEFGRLKDQQIKATGADYCIAACHNCHAQIHDLSDVRDHPWQTVHLWTLLCLSLGILGPNERVYLGDDLRDVDVFHPESEM